GQLLIAFVLHRIAHAQVGRAGCDRQPLADSHRPAPRFRGNVAVPYHDYMERTVLHRLQFGLVNSLDEIALLIELAPDERFERCARTPEMLYQRRLSATSLIVRA